MASVTIKGFIQAQKSAYSEVRYTFSQCEDMSEYGYVYIMPHEIAVELPADFNLVAGQVASLERMKKAKQDEYMAEVARINEQISKLTCIEFASVADTEHSGH